MSKIIVVTEFVSEAQNSTGFYWSRLIARSAREFTQTIVLSPTADQLAADLPSSVKGVRLLAAPAGRQMARRIFQQLALSAGLVFALLRHSRRGDTVLAGTNPALQIPAIALLQRLIGFRWVQVTHDVFPLNLKATGILPDRHPLFRALSALFASSYRCVDGIVVIGRDMEETVAGLGVAPDRITYIPNWAPIDPMGPQEVGSGKAELGWSDKIVIQFLGNIGRAQGIPELIEAIEATHNDQVRFLFAGGGAMAREVEQLAARRDDVRYLGPVPISQSRQVLELADICLVPLAPGMKGLGVPSKTYFNLAADKHILYIGEPGSEIWQLIEENPEIGWCFAPNESEKLSAFLNALSVSQLAGSKGARRRFLEQNNVEEKLLDRYMDVIRPRG